MKKQNQSQTEISAIKDVKQEIKSRFIQSLYQIISKPPSVFGYEYDIQSVMEEIRMSLDDYLKLCLNALSRQVRTSEELLLIHGYLFFMKDFTSMLLKVDKKSFNETLYTISSHLGYDHVEKEKVLFRFGEKGRKAFIILQGSISILIIKSMKMKVYAGDYIRYIANLLKYKEFGLINQALNENYSIFPVEIIEATEDKTPTDFIKKVQRKKSRIFAKSSKDGGGNSNNNNGGGNDEEKTTLFKLDQKNLSIKGLMEKKAKLFTVDELLSFYDKEKKWKEMTIVNNANAEEYVKRINILQPLNDHSLYMNKEVIEVKVFSYVNILTLGTGSFFGELALRNPNALRTASIVTNSECFFGTLNTNTYNTSLKVGAEKQRRQNVNFILSIQLFSSINHHIFQKKHFNNFTLGKCEKGTILLKELQKPQWIFLLKEGSFEVTFKASLHELTQLLKFFYVKISKESMELSKLQTDERNISHLLLENKKLEKLYHERKLIRVTEVSPPEVAGLGDYLNEKDLNAFSLECKSPKGEYYQISNYFYSEMNQKDINIKLNENLFLQKKYLFLTKRLFTIRKSTIMLLCGHKTTFINEQIAQELEEKSLRLSTMKRMFEFKKMRIESKGLKLKMPSMSNAKLRLNTDVLLSPLQEREKKKDKVKDHMVRISMMTPTIIKTNGNQPVTTNDSSNKKQKDKEKEMDNEKEKEDNLILMKIVPYAKQNEKVMRKSFNGRIEITRESNYFTKREISFDYPIRNSIHGTKPIKLNRNRHSNIQNTSLAIVTRHAKDDHSQLNKFNLTEMIWENVKPSALIPVCKTESSFQSLYPSNINTNQTESTTRRNLHPTINLKKKIQNEAGRRSQHKHQLKNQTVFLMRMNTKSKDIIDIGKYTQMKLEHYIERRNLYLLKDCDRVNYKIGGKSKNRSSTFNG